MTSEWRHVLPISVKIRARGNRRHEYSFQDEPIGFQHNMQIEHGYQTAISDFEIFENFENLGK